MRKLSAKLGLQVPLPLPSITRTLVHRSSNTITHPTPSVTQSILHRYLYESSPARSPLLLDSSQHLHAAKAPKQQQQHTSGAMAIVQPVMRGLQFLWALLVMAIIGNMIAEKNNHNPAVVNYSMFCAAFAMLSLLYLVPVAIKDSFSIHPIFPLVLDVLNTLFWFCGGVAMAAELGAHSCSNKPYINHNKITDGSSSRCTEAQASTAFLWFGFAAFLVSSVMSGLGSRGSGSVRPGIRRGPAMSQV